MNEQKVYAYPVRVASFFSDDSMRSYLRKSRTFRNLNSSAHCFHFAFNLSLLFADAASDRRRSETKYEHFVTIERRKTFCLNQCYKRSPIAN